MTEENSFGTDKIPDNLVNQIDESPDTWKFVSKIAAKIIRSLKYNRLGRERTKNHLSEYKVLLTNIVEGGTEWIR